MRAGARREYATERGHRVQMGATSTARLSSETRACSDGGTLDPAPMCRVRRVLDRDPAAIEAAGHEPVKRIFEACVGAQVSASTILSSIAIPASMAEGVRRAAPFRAEDGRTPDPRARSSAHSHTWEMT